MAKWELLASLKSAGGLGFTNTRVMNKCLLAKWIFKIEGGEDNICCNLLRQKYLGDKGFFSCKKRNCSQFWKSLQYIKDDCARGIRYIVGDGKKARFSHGTWIGECTLKIAFAGPFEICNQQDWSMHRVYNQGDIMLSFRRNFGDREELEIGEQLNMVA
jgi:hypothetical protein